MSFKLDLTAESLVANNARTIHAGDDYELSFTVTRGSSALNIAGATLWFTVKRASINPDPGVLQLTSGGASPKITITSGAAGQFKIVLEDTATADLEGLFLYDIKAKLASGLILRIAYGRIEFLPNITRAIA